MARWESNLTITSIEYIFFFINFFLYYILFVSNFDYLFIIDLYIQTSKASNKNTIENKNDQVSNKSVNKQSVQTKLKSIVLFYSIFIYIYMFFFHFFYINMLILLYNYIFNFDPSNYN